MRHLLRGLGWVEKKSLQIAYAKGFHLYSKAKIMSESKKPWTNRSSDCPGFFDSDIM